MAWISPAYRKRACHVHGLPPRLAEVAQLVSEGFSDKEIGERLYLSPGTIKIYVLRAKNRLHCSSRVELATKWRCMVCQKET